MHDYLSTLLRSKNINDSCDEILVIFLMRINFSCKQENNGNILEISVTKYI